MTAPRYLPDPFDTPDEAAHALAEYRRHDDHQEDVRRDPRVDGDTTCVNGWADELAAAYAEVAQIRRTA